MSEDELFMIECDLSKYKTLELKELDNILTHILKSVSKEKIKKLDEDYTLSKNDTTLKIKGYIEKKENSNGSNTKIYFRNIFKFKNKKNKEITKKNNQYFSRWKEITHEEFPYIIDSHGLVVFLTNEKIEKELYKRRMR